MCAESPGVVTLELMRHADSMPACIDACNLAVLSVASDANMNGGTDPICERTCAGGQSTAQLKLSAAGLGAELEL
jgi:hypothetical protein|tara:strand:- start:873 stop:1097 length:225 start_codon:yes stop_codon:yes gene_type:complete